MTDTDKNLHMLLESDIKVNFNLAHIINLKEILIILEISKTS